MKVWPIITLGALIWGASISDGMNVKRESNPHPRLHHNTLDAEVAADFAPPHRPVTMAFREVFAKLLNEETDWSAPEDKAATVETTGDADDGEDPGKKLFWHSVFPDNPGVPFPGWGDPTAEPDHPLVSPPACSSCRPDLFFIIEDPAPPHEDENFALEAGNANSQMLASLPFGALKAIDNLVVAVDPGGKPIVTVMPCETIIVNGICPLPCKGDDDPLCKGESDPPPPVISDPGGGSIPPVAGGGGSPPIIGVGGGGGGGAVPEPSTWLLLGLGLLALAGFKWRFSAAR
jgi:PEP-CTERM motif